MLKQTLTVLVAGLAMAGLAHAADASKQPVPDFIAAAVADPARPATDTERDANRKPAEMLVFAGVKPGAKVLEIEPGEGYFTRLFAKALGSGHLYVLVSPPLPADAPQNIKDMIAKRKEAIDAIAKAAGNVTVTPQSYSSFKVSEPVDIVWTSQNYHDFKIARFGVDIVKFNKSAFDALKPGGVFIVLDHSAVDGSGVGAVETLHRIDEAVVKQEVEAAGFKLIAHSDVLRNAADKRDAMVFDPSIRGKTDQFILAFQKPAQ